VDARPLGELLHVHQAAHLLLLGLG
jgi:hypothetical protein